MHQDYQRKLLTFGAQVRTGALHKAQVDGFNTTNRQKTKREQIIQNLFEELITLHSRWNNALALAESEVHQPRITTYLSPTQTSQELAQQFEEGRKKIYRLEREVKSVREENSRLRKKVQEDEIPYLEVVGEYAEEWEEQEARCEYLEEENQSLKEAIVGFQQHVEVSLRFLPSAFFLLTSTRSRERISLGETPRTIQESNTRLLHQFQGLVHLTQRFKFDENLQRRSGLNLKDKPQNHKAGGASNLSPKSMLRRL
jgi:hypothetical protein